MKDQAGDERLGLLIPVRFAALPRRVVNQRVGEGVQALAAADSGSAQLLALGALDGFDDVLAAARESAAAAGVTGADRVMSSAPWDSADDVIGRRKASQFIEADELQERALRLADRDADD